jgi:DNA-binding transcriptional ArsR family regulator
MTDHAPELGLVASGTTSRMPDLASPTHALRYMPRQTYTIWGILRVVSVSGTVNVIAEPSRLSILNELRNGERTVSALVEKLEMSQPAMSKHLRILRDAGLVSVRPDGQRRLYRVRPEPLMELDAWLEPYRQMWIKSLDRLESHLHESQTTPRRKRP